MRATRAMVVGAFLCLAAPSYAKEGDRKATDAIPTAELPRTGIVFDVPKDAFVVGIAADGAVLTNGKEGGLLELRVALRTIAADPRMHDADGLVKADVVLRASASVPWAVVQWVMQACAQSRIYRLYFAVSPEQGGEEGVIDAFLPRDRGLPPAGPEPVAETLTIPVMLLADEGTADPGTVFAKIRKLLADHEVGVEIETPPPNVPRAGHIVTILDLARRAGAKRITFTGSVVPVPARREQGIPFSAGALPWLREWVAERNRSVAAGVIVKVGTTLVAGTPDGKPAPLPPPPPRGSVGAGTSFAAGEPPDAEPLPREPMLPPPEAAVPDAPLVAPAAGKGAFDRRASRYAGGAASEQRVNDAIEVGLAWLANHQSPDGRWEAAGFANWCYGESVRTPTVDGQGMPSYDVGVTGLAVLACLGAGYATEPPFERWARKGLAWLRETQDAEGCFGPRQSSHYVYNHAIATLAFVEAYGMTGNPIYRAPTQKALDFVAIARNPYFAWRYGVKPGDNDTSVTGWMLLALDAARRVNAAEVAAGGTAPLQIDQEAFDGVKAWIDKMTDPATGRVGYQLRGTGPARPTELKERFPSDRAEGLTGIGVFARIRLGEDPATSEPIRRGIGLIAARPPVWNEADGSIDLYSWRLCAIAMAQVGGDAATSWRKALVAALVDNQRTTGDQCDAKGSWDPIDPWGSDGGRVYSTSMALLALLAPYSWEPPSAKPR